MIGGPAGQRRGQPAEYLFQRHSVGQVRLRVEEDLGPAYSRRRGAGQIGAGQVVEVLLGPQHTQVRVVHVEKGLQAVELVLSAQFADVQGRHPGIVAGREADQQFGLKRALDVNVQLSDRQHAIPSVAGPDVGVIVLHHVHRGFLRAGRSAVDAGVARDQIGLLVRMGALILGHQPACPRIRAVVEQEPVDVLIGLILVVGLFAVLLRHLIVDVESRVRLLFGE